VFELNTVHLQSLGFFKDSQRLLKHEHIKMFVKKFAGLLDGICPVALNKRCTVVLSKK